MAKTKRRKGSRNHNVLIRWRQICNGMEQAKQNSPRFILKNGKIRKLSAQAYRDLVDSCADLGVGPAEFGFAVSPHPLD